MRGYSDIFVGTAVDEHVETGDGLEWDGVHVDFPSDLGGNGRIIDVVIVNSKKWLKGIKHLISAGHRRRGASNRRKKAKLLVSSESRISYY